VFEQLEKNAEFELDVSWKHANDRKHAERGRERGVVRFFSKNRGFGIINRTWEGLNIIGGNRTDPQAMEIASRAATTPGIWFREASVEKERRKKFIMLPLKTGDEVYYRVRRRRNYRRDNTSTQSGDRSLYADDIERVPETRFDPLSEKFLVYSGLRRLLGDYWFVLAGMNEEELTFDDVRNMTEEQLRKEIDLDNKIWNVVQERYGDQRYIRDPVPSCALDPERARRERRKKREEIRRQALRDEKLIQSAQRKHLLMKQKLSEAPNSNSGNEGEDNSDVEDAMADLEAEMGELGQGPQRRDRDIDHIVPDKPGLDVAEFFNKLPEAYRSFRKSFREEHERDKRISGKWGKGRTFPSFYPPGQLHTSFFFDAFEGETLFYPVPKVGHRVRVMKKDHGWVFGNITSIGRYNILPTKIMGESHPKCVKWPVSIEFDDSSYNNYAYPDETNRVRLGSSCEEGEQDEYHYVKNRLKNRRSRGQQALDPNENIHEVPMQVDDANIIRQDGGGDEGLDMELTQPVSKAYSKEYAAKRSKWDVFGDGMGGFPRPLVVRSISEIQYQMDSESSDDDSESGFIKMGQLKPEDNTEQPFIPAKELIIVTGNKAARILHRRKWDDIMASSDSCSAREGENEEEREKRKDAEPFFGKVRHPYQPKRHGSVWVAPKLRRALRKLGKPSVTTDESDKGYPSALGITSSSDTPWHHTRDSERRVAVITGADAGIGFAIAHRLVTNEPYLTILLCAPTLERAKEACEKLSLKNVAEVIPAKFDPLDPKDATRITERVRNEFASLDLIITCSSVLPISNEQGQEERILEGNFFATVRLTEKLSPLLRPNSRVVILVPPVGVQALRQCSERLMQSFIDPRQTARGLEMLANRFGATMRMGRNVQEGFPTSLYGGAKMFLLSYTRVLARQMATRGDNVTVNACIPDEPPRVRRGVRPVVWSENEAVTTAFKMCQTNIPANFTGGTWFNGRQVF